MNERILFCNIAYMLTYSGKDFDIPVNGGSYVKENNKAYESKNFLKEKDGYYYGFVETKYKDGYKIGLITNEYNKIHIEKIDKNFKNKKYIEDVLVIFCAKSPIKNKTVIVGFYKKATVYRNRLYVGDRFYNLKCKTSDGYVIKEKDRKFIVPRASTSDNKIGFGQANIWYANKEKDYEFKKSVISYIENL